MENNRIKKTKIFVSLKKEKNWLEEMALEGYKLVNITLGSRYTFEKMEPKRLIYEVDRFNLPKNPTLSEIKSKSDALMMAKEMGWEIAAHDEDLNYYFCKEYVVDEMNELYPDEVSRQIRADKYKNRYISIMNEMMKVITLLAICSLVVILIEKENMNGFVFTYMCFVIVFMLFCSLMSQVYFKMSSFYYNEFLQSDEDWKRTNDFEAGNVKKVRKYFFRAKSLREFLSEEASNGWVLTKATRINYFFEKGEPGEFEFAFDSAILTNARRKKGGESRIRDKKDINGIGNDWQVQSVKDAEEKKWEFTCAFYNKLILYKVKKEIQAEKLNPSGKSPFIGIVSCQAGLFILGCMGVGFVVGFLWGVLSNI